MMISEEEGGRGNISISHVQQNRKFTTELGRAGGSCSDVCANRRRGGDLFCLEVSGVVVGFGP